MSSELAIKNGNQSVGSYLAKYGKGTAGINFKFDGKEKSYIKTSTKEKIEAGREFVYVYPRTVVNWLKFNGPGNPPTRIGGYLFDGYNLPERSTLADTDQSSWDKGPSGKPEDPWILQVLLPLQDKETGELFIFQASNSTSRAAADRLIESCMRMQLKEPGFFPVVKNDISGFQHREKHVGWVPTPTFARVGKAPADDLALATSAIADDLNDEIPF